MPVQLTPRLASGFRLRFTPGLVYAAAQAPNSIPLGDIVAIANNRFLGNVSGVTANVAALTATEVKTGLALVKGDVGLGNVDNTSDANKPVSTATQTALDAKAPLASPTFTGIVSGITKAMVGLGSVDNTSDASKPVSTAQQTALDLKANIASPTFTGTPAGPTATAGTNTTQLATTAFVTGALGSYLTTSTAASTYAPIASPTFTGKATTAASATGGAGLNAPHGTAPTSPADGDVWTTTSGVFWRISGTTQQTAFLASPTFTGTPAAPTATVDTNTTQVATTAFVLAQAGASTPLTDGTATVGTSTRFARDDHRHGTDTSRAAVASPTFTGTVTTAASATGGAGLNLPHGAAPTSPTNGDLWTTSAGGLFVRVNGTTQNLAPLASPTFTGTPAAPTATADTNTTQVATTAYVIGQKGTATPIVDGTGTAGTSNKWAPIDHVHPTDTSRAPLASPTFTGTPAAPTPSTSDNSTKIATTAYVQAVVPTGAWTTFTASATGGGGSGFTASASGAYRIVGKTCFLRLTISLSAAGTGVGYIAIDSIPAAALPITPAILVGRDVGNTGKQCNLTLSNALSGGGSTNGTVSDYSNGYPFANTSVIYINGVYELA